MIRALAFFGVHLLDNLVRRHEGDREDQRHHHREDPEENEWTEWHCRYRFGTGIAAPRLMDPPPSLT